MLLAVLGLTAGACAVQEETPPLRAAPGVQVFGRLRDILHEGRTGARVSLGGLLPDPDLCAVGALAGLAGEITIVRGEAWLSRPDGDGGSRTEASLRSDAGATLLVAASVPAWQEVVLAEDVPFAGLDEAIARLAAGAGLSLDGRIPFLVEGELRDLDWHVVDGSRLPPGPATHADHRAAAVRGHADRARAVLVGFWSAADQGVFTHMDSRTHVHCVLRDLPAAGHLDGALLPAGVRVLFPAPGWDGAAG